MAHMVPRRRFVFSPLLVLSAGWSVQSMTTNTNPSSSSSFSSKIVNSKSVAHTSDVIDLVHTQTPLAADIENKRDPSSSSQRVPTTLFLHGLDSSSHTWRNVLKRMSAKNLPAVAVDLRGSGQSPLGKPDEFTRDSLVQDVKSVVNHHPLLHGGGRQENDTKEPFVLVGHSMGGRVAMCYANQYPNDIAALIIEDMDVKCRTLDSSPVPVNRSIVRGFNRKFTSQQEVIEALHKVGYSLDGIKRWIDEGRIRELQDENGGEKYWWTDVNPEFRVLCYEQFCENDSGEETWKALVSQQRKLDSKPFPCHVMVAGDGQTICDENSIQFMINEMEKVQPLTVHRYPDATHSIHNSVEDEFMETLEGIISHVATNKEAKL